MAFWVINAEGNDPVFLDLREEKVVEFLEQNESDGPRTVYDSEKNTFLSESEFLDLAT